MSEPITPEPVPSPSGREADGRYAKGNPGGCGNPFARKCAALRAALLRTTTEQDIEDIAAKLRDDAKAGDKAAVKLLFQYVIGKPQPAVDPDTLDIQEMRTFMAGAFPPEVLEEMQRAMPLSLLLKLWPTFLDVKERTNTDFCGQRLDKIDDREQRRAERAQKKAERRQRRQEARERAQANKGTTPAVQPHGAPSTNGHHNVNGHANGIKPPSTHGDVGQGAFDVLQRWLRAGRRPSGDPGQP